MSAEVADTVGSVDNMPVDSQPQTDVSTSSPKQAAEKKHILNLPPELRNAIYEFTVIEPHQVPITSRQPGLTRTCRQVRSESLPMYLQRNAFKASARNWTGIDQLVKSFAAMRRTHAQQITRLTIEKPRCLSPHQILATQHLDKLIWRLKSSGIAAGAVTWNVQRGYMDDDVLNESWAAFQVSHEDVIAPLLRLYEYAFVSDSTKPGYYLHQQREQARAEFIVDGEEAAMVDAMVEEDTLNYIDTMYALYPDAYIWTEEHQAQLLQEYARLQKKVGSVGESLAHAQKSQECGLGSRDLGVARLQTTLRDTSKRLADFRSRYRVLIEDEELYQKLSSRDRVPVTSRDEYGSRRMAAVGEVAKSGDARAR